jgi:hypothetical protein
MATVKNKIRRLQRLQHRLRCEESIRQFENRSKEERGHFKVRNDNQRVVKPEEIRAFEKSLYALARGRTLAQLKYYAEHGAWPEREQGLAEVKLTMTSGRGDELEKPRET